MGSVFRLIEPDWAGKSIQLEKFGNNLLLFIMAQLRIAKCQWPLIHRS